MTRGIDWIPLSSLKGIGVSYEDDLHDLALLMLRLNDARAAYEGTNAIARPSVNGLAKKFAELIEPCRPDYGPPFAAIEEHQLPLGATIEFDSRIKR